MEGKMAKNRAWQAYPDSYRAKELKMLADWIAAGESGSVVGLVGCGRSNLLGFLCHRPDVLRDYLPTETGSVFLIPVDLLNLPMNDLATLYRTILHAFYWVREQLPLEFQQPVINLYMENRAIQDPFLSQRALYELFRLFQEQNHQIALVLNRFDRFCQIATPQMINTLRGLRDGFKDTLCYLVGLPQDVAYLPDPTALGDMYELLDSHVCWVGAMSETDARYMLDTVLYTVPPPPSEPEIQLMLTLTGCFPVLLKAVGQWWQRTRQHPPDLNEWLDILLEDDAIHYRLTRMWNSLTQEEQLALTEVQKLQTQATENLRNLSKKLDNAAASLAKHQRYALARLQAKGLCCQIGQGWWITGELLAAYVAQVKGRVRGRIWLDEQTKNVYQGKVSIEELTTLEGEILRFLLENARIKHTREDIIDNAWPEEDQRDGITTNALHVHIASIRKKIEPNPAKPRYLITWRGRPGGYQFFPEGKPD
jgi:hypothetical protein